MSNYGKLGTKTLAHAAYQIWLTRNDELAPCEPFGWYANTIQESDHMDDQDEGKALLKFMLAKVAKHEISPRYVMVIIMHTMHDMSFDEIAVSFGAKVSLVRNTYLKGTEKVRLLWAQRP